MLLTVLGSGTCEIRPEASSPAYLVEAGQAAFLLDLGQGALRRLLEAGRDPARLTAALISHHHPDHMADLIPLLFALNYDPRMKAQAGLSLVGHPGLQGVLGGLAQAFGHWLEPDPANLTPRWLQAGQSLELAGTAIHTAAAAHVATSLAYRLEHRGASLVYLGDSQATPELVEFCRGAELVIAHCAGPDDAPKPGHLTPGAAGRLAQEAGAASLLLSHLYSTMDPLQALASAQADFGGPVWLARDLSSWEILPGRVLPVNSD